MESRRRVKIYELSAESKWVDKGTGQCSCDYVERKQGSCLVVRSEENGSILIESRILASASYQRQQDSLIVWSEPSSGDVALSFQDINGCNEIWSQILEIQRRALHNDDDDTTSEFVIEERAVPRDRVQINLPRASLATLKEFDLAIHDHVGNQQSRSQLGHKLATDQSYLIELKELFTKCEDLDMTDTLFILYKIFKSLILLNESPLLEVLFKDDYIMTVMGALEYDPEFAERRPHHREYLENECTFKQVVPLSNQEVSSKIHQTFKLQYLKDVVLPRSLDDATFTTINSFIFFNYVDIVQHLQTDDHFLEELFSLVKKQDIRTDRQKQAILFIQDFCNVSKGIHITQRADFYRALCQHGLFEIFAQTINHEDMRVRLAATEILSCLLDFKTSMLRSFLLDQQQQLDQSPTSAAATRPDASLFRQLIKRFHDDDDEGMKAQFADILRVLLDNEATPDEEANERDNFLNVFYEKYIQNLFEPLKRVAADSPNWNISMLSSTVSDPDLDFDLQTQALYSLLLDLLCFFVQRHSYRIKYFILGQSFASKLLILLRSKQKHVALSALRLFRTFIGTKDEFYFRYITKNNLFVPIVRLFQQNENKDNLVNSAILELFDFIKRENLKSLIDHVVENFRPYFQHIKYVRTFEHLVLKYDQNHEVVTNGGQSDTDERNAKRPRDRGLDEDEEAYFNDEDDTEDTPLSSDHGIDFEELRPRISASRAERERSLSPPLSATNGSKSPGSPRSRSPPSWPSMISSGVNNGSPQRLIKLVDYEGEEEDDDEDAGSPSAQTPTTTTAVVDQVNTATAKRQRLS